MGSVNKSIKISILMPVQLLLLTVALCLASCSSKTPVETSSGKNLAEDARYMRIFRGDNYTRVEIVNPTDTTRFLGSYIFPDNDTATIAASASSNATLLYPKALQRLMVYSAVHGAALKELGELNRIKAVGDADYFTVPEIRKALAEKKVVDAGTSKEPVKERIMQSSPGAVIVSWYPGLDDTPFKRLGIPVIYMAESQEASPLGRAEWLKLLGFISGKYNASDSIFKQTKLNYNSLKAKAGGVKQRPKVMAETMYEGVWNVAGGKSYAARLIADAGGNYLWSDDGSEGSLSLPFEAVLAKAADADIWLLRVFGIDLTTDRLRGMDERYMLFSPAKDFNKPGKGIWSSNTQVVPFFEETPFHPDRLLKDYIAIFHPELMSGYSPIYFKKVDK